MQREIEVYSIVIVIVIIIIVTTIIIIVLVLAAVVHWGAHLHKPVKDRAVAGDGLEWVEPPGRNSRREQRRRRRHCAGRHDVDEELVVAAGGGALPLVGVLVAPQGLGGDELARAVEAGEDPLLLGRRGGRLRGRGRRRRRSGVDEGVLVLRLLGVAVAVAAVLATGGGGGVLQSWLGGGRGVAKEIVEVVGVRH